MVNDQYIRKRNFPKTPPHFLFISIVKVEFYLIRSFRLFVNSWHKCLFILFKRAPYFHVWKSTVFHLLISTSSILWQTHGMTNSFFMLNSIVLCIYIDVTKWWSTLQTQALFCHSLKVQEVLRFLSRMLWNMCCFLFMKLVSLPTYIARWREIYVI